MGAQAPQWLFSAFVEAMTQIGATASTATLSAEARDLVSRWNEPGRYLHNAQYLINVLASIDELAAVAHDPDVLRVALWYHGAFYDRSFKLCLDEDVVAQPCSPCVAHAHDRLLALGVSDDVVARVEELMQALVARRASRSDSDAQVLVDADRALFAASPQAYKKHRLALREEFAALDDLTYWRARRKAVRRLLALDSLYYSPLAQQWEETARSNLEAELAKLESEIRGVDPTLCGEGPEAVDHEDASEHTDAGAGSTLIIRRRPLKKNVCAQPEEPTSTGVLPTIRPADGELRGLQDDDDSASSLETAIDAMDLPHTSGS
ncbi:hypothetical protein [Schaalia suimastitidis]|uniref:HD domain-containing protein n=1 Tax=Schaalia suimastitidis TaxID=121163 RepID=UPI00040A8539|nr:hypothetical protein [Schaalia suimastitidis]